MPLPDGYYYVSSANFGGTPPITELQVPDDGTQPSAEDIVRVAIAMLANDEYYADIVADPVTGLDSKVAKAGDIMTGGLVVDHPDGVVTTGKVEVGTTLEFGAERTYTRVCQPLGGAGPDWDAPPGDSVVFPYSIAQQAPTTANPFTWKVPVADGGTLTSLQITIQPPPAHSGEPANKPTFYLYRWNTLTRTKTLLDSVTDTQALPDYENQRVIGLGPLAALVAGNEVLIAALAGEFGANSLDGLAAAAPIAEFTRTKVGEE